MVPMIDIPAVCARLLVSDNKPDATPSLSGGAAPKISLLLGILKVPNPIATGKNLTINPTTPVSGVSVFTQKHPIAMIRLILKERLLNNDRSIIGNLILF
jgi:hypothetical protein